jgi:hypothetical protein
MAFISVGWQKEKHPWSFEGVVEERLDHELN